MELARFSGWGQFPQVFLPHTVAWDERAKWAERRERIEVLLGGTDSAAYAAAASTTLNAHYTHPAVAAWTWEAVRSMGFRGGRVLEPSCGTGNFIGTCPDEIRNRSTFVAVEIDPTTAHIADLLYPDPRVRVIASPFEKSRLPDGYFDLAISNVPFGDYRVFDPATNRDYSERTGLRIHNYFFAAAARKVREGGLVAFISSAGTLDAATAKPFRHRLGDELDFLGAVRLPSSAFARSAGTEVTTDVLFFERRAPGLTARHAGPWIESHMAARSETGTRLAINEWYEARPEMMLGRIAEDTLHRARAALAPDGRDLEDALRVAQSGLAQPRSDPTRSTRPPFPDDPRRETLAIADASVSRWTRQGGYVVRETSSGLELFALAERELASVTASRETVRRVRDALLVRDALRDLLEAERTRDDGPELDAMRDELGRRYAAFRESWEAFGHVRNRRAFGDDPDYPVLIALERRDSASGRIERAAVFSRRVVARPRAVVRMDSVRDALRVSLAESGDVAVERIAALVGADVPTVEATLAREGLAFRDPSDGRWIDRDAYLSGDVVAKLETARLASSLDETMAANVTALETVQPARISIADIGVRIGAGWIPEAYVEEFILAISECRATARYIAPTAEWVVHQETHAYGVRNTKEYGTGRFSAVDLIGQALNFRVPTAWDDIGGGRRAINFAETEAARAKQDRIKSRFVEWLLENTDRASEIERIFNDRFNRVRLRQFDGSPFEIAGLAAEWSEGGPMALRPHQYAAIRRIASGQSTLLSHVVGAGKTAEMVVGAMELRRTGLARKPMFVVPNHLVGQFADEFRSIIPGADVLVQSDTDFAAANRARFLARIATSTPDAIVVSHSSFTMIPMRPEAQQEFVSAQIADLELALWSLSEGDRGPQKKIQAAMKRLEARLERLLHVKRDETMTFEELGVDSLFVDESHAFKNLAYQTKLQRVAGLSDSESKRAEDMYLKCGYIESLRGEGKGIVFATGTPITNTIAEGFTLERFLARAELRRRGLGHFDAWVALYSDPVTGWETDSLGRFTVKTRFAAFRNVPELRTSFRRFADVRTADDLELPVPPRAGNLPVAVLCPQNGLQKAALEWLEQRVDRLRSDRVDPSIDNMLKITTEARKLSLDARLLFPEAQAFRSGKISAAAEVIHHVWEATEQARATQIVFSDLGTPGDDRAFTVYDELARELTKRGVPSSEIAFIHDFAKQDEKRRLFEDVNAGRVRVLVGSSQKLGAGANVQRRMVAIHQLDVPWLPADIEQRNGRVERQGNLCREFWEFRYVAVGDEGRAGFDSYMWEMVGRKAAMIRQVVGREDGQRSVEDVSGRPLSAAEFQAVAHGNPLLREKIEVDSNRGRLERLRLAWYDDRAAVSRRREELPGRIASAEARLERTRMDAAAAEGVLAGERFEMEVLGERHSDRAEAGKALRARAAAIATGAFETVGRVGPFDVDVESSAFGNRILLVGHEVAGRQSSYEANLTDTDTGTIGSIWYRLRSIAPMIAEQEGTLAVLRREEARIAEMLARPFDGAEELERLEARAREIDEALGIGRSDEQAVAAAAAGAVESDGDETTSPGAECPEVEIEIRIGAPVRPDAHGFYDDPVPIERPWLPDPERLRDAVSHIVDVDRSSALEVAERVATDVASEHEAATAEVREAPAAAARVVDSASLETLRQAREAAEAAARQARAGRADRDAERQRGDESIQLKLF